MRDTRRPWRQALIQNKRDEPYPPPLRVASECALCGSPLQLRRNRTTGELFVGCGDFPRCGFAEPYEALHAALVERLAAVEAEREELLDELAEADAKALFPATLDLARELRALIAVAHPDRWPANPLSHEVTARLTELRARIAA